MFLKLCAKLLFWEFKGNARITKRREYGLSPVSLDTAVSRLGVKFLVTHMN